jgi:hypothetical protein
MEGAREGGHTLSGMEEGREEVRTENETEGAR